MALTGLDPKTALVVIDLQQGLLSLLPPEALSGVVKQAGALASAFRSSKLPVVLVTVVGAAPGRTEQPRRAFQSSANWAELVPELGRQPSDHVIAKRTWGAFTNTDLGDYLHQHGVTQVVLAGVATCGGVESTARQAHEHGFNVTLAVDAMTDPSQEAHLNSVTRIFPRLGETGTAQEIIQLLKGAR